MGPLPAIEKVKRLGVDVHRQCEILCRAHDTQGLFDLERHMVSTRWRPAQNHRRWLTLYSAVPRYFLESLKFRLFLWKLKAPRVILAVCGCDFFLKFVGLPLSGGCPL